MKKGKTESCKYTEFAIEKMGRLIIMISVTSYLCNLHIFQDWLMALIMIYLGMWYLLPTFKFIEDRKEPDN